MRKLRIGFLVNPYAGVGGATAFKGSDDKVIQEKAIAGEVALTSPSRANVFLEELKDLSSSIYFVAPNDSMGGNLLQQHAFAWEPISYSPASPSSREDTQKCVEAIGDRQVDVLIFVGGDGTARDVCDVLPRNQLVLGVPAGVKMHSGVYAINPRAAAEVIRLMVYGELVGVSSQEVRDIDESAFRQNRVISRHYGEMRVPNIVQYVQHVKQGGIEVEDLVVIDIADHLSENIDNDTLLIFGPGSTTHKIMSRMGWEGTLLGVDVCMNGVLIQKDCTAEGLLAALEQYDVPKLTPVKLVVTAIGGQGHIFGRGNQQLSPYVLRHIGLENISLVATKEKLKSLEGRPLLLDTGDGKLDKEWSGYISVVTGYHDEVCYPLEG